ncbi:Trp biosynthesis-associated membrane protein [Lacisediminihabitans profunda]|uniref:Trp biosynthesis-associated membrane protein n=1 Tax=Lacisediminihabitans profunda TaxID=2594790 RepID=A0A5C8UU39_9MICO|nr:Trp biosynthesis-associated membrane protein [Lacisediminihabitans profunda]TXN32064.1 Trp biosynthesis-associated membrane protein [Lacisediminihabitans profunda]
MTSGRRLKSIGLLGGLVVSGLTLLTWTGQWFSLRLGASGSGTTTLSVTGGVAAPGLIALALAGLALVAALAIAGPVFRIVLGVLQALLGFTVAFSSVVALADPVAASSTAVTAATGVSGTASVSRLVLSVTQTAWPWIAVIVGVATIGLGIFVLVSSRRWPGSSRRYQPVTFEPAEPGANAVSDWDTLSGGSDPTSR